jgi:hypothetical protein
MDTLFDFSSKNFYYGKTNTIYFGIYDLFIESSDPKVEMEFFIIPNRQHYGPYPYLSTELRNDINTIKWKRGEYCPISIMNICYGAKFYIYCIKNGDNYIYNDSNMLISYSVGIIPRDIIQCIHLYKDEVTNRSFTSYVFNYVEFLSLIYTAYPTHILLKDSKTDTYTYKSLNRVSSYKYVPKYPYNGVESLYLEVQHLKEPFRYKHIYAKIFLCKPYYSIDSIDKSISRIIPNVRSIFHYMKFKQNITLTKMDEFQYRCYNTMYNCIVKRPYYSAHRQKYKYVMNELQFYVYHKKQYKKVLYELSFVPGHAGYQTTFEHFNQLVNQ